MLLKIYVDRSMWYCSGPVGKGDHEGLAMGEDDSVASPAT